MATLNIQKAKQAGFSDDEIRKYLAKNPQFSGGGQPQMQQPKGSPLAELLPLIASLIGGGVGTLVAPGVGTIAGSAIGSGLGELGRQSVRGEKTNVGKIAGETAIGGLAGGAGVLLGRLGKAGKIAKTLKAGKTATQLETEAEGNVLTKAGKAIRGSVAKPIPAKTPRFALEAEDITKFTTGRYTGSAAKQAKQLGVDYEKQLALIKELTNKKGIGDISVAGKELAKKMGVGVAQEVDTTTGIGKANVSFWGKKLRKVKTVKELGELNAQLLKEMGNAPKGKKQILYAIQKPVSEALKTKVPEIKEPLGIMSNIHKARPGLQKATEQSYSFYGAKFPKTPVQAAKDYTGRGMVKAGQTLENYRTPLSLGAGQAGVRMFTGGDYEAPPSDMETPMAQQYQAQQPEAGFKITAEQAALARLLLPDKQADAIEAAYKLLGGDTKDSASAQKRQTILNQASPVLERIASSALNAPTGFAGSALSLAGKIPGVAGGEAEFLRRDTEAFARLIAAAFATEVGVATDRDVERWLNLMPRPGDTMGERRRQIEKLTEQIYSESQLLDMEPPPAITNIIQMLQQ